MYGCAPVVYMYISIVVAGSTVNSNASGPTDLHKLIDNVMLDEPGEQDDVGSKTGDTPTKSDGQYICTI